MNKSPPFRARQARREPLDALLDRLEPALQGYPVKELVDLWVEVEDEGTATERLIELCLSNWIARLDLEDGAVRVDEDLPEDLRARQRCAHHALVLVRARFRRSAISSPGPAYAATVSAATAPSPGSSSLLRTRTRS